MGIEWLLSGLFILFVLGLLVGVVSSLVIILGGIAKDTPSQQRFLTASLLTGLVKLER